MVPGERPRKKINTPNGEVEVVPLTFQTVGENWNEYLLNDGTVVKLKLIATEFMRLVGVFDPDGNPQYISRSSNVMAASVSQRAREEAKEDH